MQKNMQRINIISTYLARSNCMDNSTKKINNSAFKVNL